MVLCLESRARVSDLVKVFVEFERGLQSVLRDVSSRYDDLVRFAEDLANRYASDLEKEVAGMIRELEEDTERRIRDFESEKVKMIRELEESMNKTASERFSSVVDEVVREFWRRIGS